MSLVGLRNHGIIEKTSLLNISKLTEHMTCVFVTIHLIISSLPIFLSNFIFSNQPVRQYAKII